MSKYLGPLYVLPVFTILLAVIVVVVAWFHMHPVIGIFLGVCYSILFWRLLRDE